jgi:hypothetical protein
MESRVAFPCCSKWNHANGQPHITHTSVVVPGITVENGIYESRQWKVTFQRSPEGAPSRFYFIMNQESES